MDNIEYLNIERRTAPKEKVQPSNRPAKSPLEPFARMKSGLRYETDLDNPKPKMMSTRSEQTVDLTKDVEPEGCGSKSQAVYKNIMIRMKRHFVTREIAKLMVLATFLSRDDFSVFVYYFAHRDKLKVEIYPVGWSNDRFHTFTIEGYLPSLDRPIGLTVKQVRAAIDLIKTLGSGPQTRPLDATDLSSPAETVSRHASGMLTVPVGQRKGDHHRTAKCRLKHRRTQNMTRGRPAVHRLKDIAEAIQPGRTPLYKPTRKMCAVIQHHLGSLRSACSARGPAARPHCIPPALVRSGYQAQFQTMHSSRRWTSRG